MSSKEKDEISDTDRDSLHTLPLSILPLETPSLARARLIKNVRLNSVIELFTDKDTGSGQIDIEDLPHQFNWDMSDPPADMAMMRILSNAFFMSGDRNRLMTSSKLSILISSSPP